MKSVPKGPLDKKWALVPVMAWHQTGNKPFHEPTVSKPRVGITKAPFVNSLAPRRCECDSKNVFSILFYWLVSSDLHIIMPSDECHRTSLMINSHWFRLWLGAVRQQAITWANVDQDLCHYGVTRQQWVNVSPLPGILIEQKYRFPTFLITFIFVRCLCSWAAVTLPNINKIFHR